MLIQTGMDEVLLSDSTRLAERAREVGIDVTLDLAEGMWHVYQAFAGVVPEATDALVRAAVFMRVPCAGGAAGMSPSEARFPELGFYMLAGGAQNPRDLVTECARAEELGLGAAFISERFDVKEAATLSGAAAVASTNLQIITGATNHNTRHPIVTASYATTMHRLTGGRFVLGIGRGVAAAVGCVRDPPHHDGADGGLRAVDAPALARRDRDRPRRAGGFVPGPAARSDVRRGHPARAGGVRAELAGAGRAGVRPRDPAHVLHRRDAAALRADRQGCRRARRS